MLAVMMILHLWSFFSTAFLAVEIIGNCYNLGICGNELISPFHLYLVKPRNLNELELCTAIFSA